MIILPFNDFLKNVNSIDLYVNYFCGLRCNHCFIGDLLNSNIEMPISMIKAILQQCVKFNIKNITLLGGEPTLHKNINEIVHLFVTNGINIRIVTNGQKSFQNLISNLSPNIKEKIHVCFSVDGANAEVHDRIRGNHVFSKLCKSIELARYNKISMSAITSVSKSNCDDLFKIIDFCYQEGMKYLNIHYVTDRGFANKSNLVDIEKWKEICAKMKSVKSHIRVRIEETFVPVSRNIGCEVTRKENLIIDPRGRIYGCTMFMNLDNSYTGIWNEDGVEINENEANENKICSCTKNGCPAMKLVNSDLETSSMVLNNKIDCIFNKTEIL